MLRNERADKERRNVDQEADVRLAVRNEFLTSFHHLSR